MNPWDIVLILAAVALLLILAAILVTLVGASLVERASFAREYPGQSYDEMVRRRRRNTPRTGRRS